MNAKDVFRYCNEFMFWKIRNMVASKEIELPAIEMSDADKSRIVELAILKLFDHTNVIAAHDVLHGTYSVKSNAKVIIALCDFFDGKFALSGMKVLKDIEGKTFKDLANGLACIIEGTPFSFMAVQKCEGIDEVIDEVVKFSI